LAIIKTTPFANGMVLELRAEAFSHECAFFNGYWRERIR